MGYKDRQLFFDWSEKTGTSCVDLPGSSIGFNGTEAVFHLEIVDLGKDSLPATIIQRKNAHCGAGFPTGISVTYECIDGADNLALLLEGVRFMGRVHYLTAMTINYVNYEVDKQFYGGLTHFHYITFSLHYCTNSGAYVGLC
jgi:hypothetical protein